MKLIRRSGYVFAMVMPFMGFAGDSKASTQLSPENKLLVANDQADDFKFIKSISENTWKLKPGNFFIAEDSSNEANKLYIKTCTKKDPQSEG